MKHINNKNNKTYKLIYTPKKDKPMQVIIFASGSGGNLSAAINTSKKNPSLLNIGLVVTDRLGIKAIDIAKENNIPVIVSDFEKECGVWGDCKKDPEKKRRYFELGIKYHDRVLTQILRLEQTTGKQFDLIVLSYHRWIHGKLLAYFKDKIINQHAGDLSIMKKDYPLERKYTGINPVLIALKRGEIKTRTSTFLVCEGHDTGEILCQGPWVTYNGSYPITKESALEHEIIQKRESDWPSLIFALERIAKGEFGISLQQKHLDGGRVLVFKRKALLYTGVDIAEHRK